MKKYQVKTEFIEKYHDNRYYAVDSEYESGDDERVDYLQQLGFLGDEVTTDVDGDGLDDRLKHVGGGYYELPNGDKVRGKEKATEALQAIDEAGSGVEEA